MAMDKQNKERYERFCERNYVPIFSKAWWMDAICGEESWDVWISGEGNDIVAAMPYYFENRNGYKYITKAKLTQNNGILFREQEGKRISKAAFEEKIINQANDFIKTLQLDVYEQQFHYSFQNWLPFFWNRYTAITRYTYVVEAETTELAWSEISSKYKSKIKKGSQNTEIIETEDYRKFYIEHEKVFLKQNLSCPFSFHEWERLYLACKEHSAARMFFSIEPKGNVASLIFLVQDARSVYQLLGGSMPGYENLDSYDALIWHGIEEAIQLGLVYDFEGSVIQRIAKSFREFGGVPKPYFRIRKVFNPEIVRNEAECYIKAIKGE